MLDMNVVIIIGLMIMISIINMVSALLIVILERRPQVGLLKALGMNDAMVIKLFVRYAARIIGGGFIAGNILGLGICLVQTKTGLLTLDPAAYYVSEVPILLDFTRLASIEIVAFVTCIIAMLLPAWYSTRIQPSTALRIK
jgi:lipoprotein-releasing system permease protein